MNRYAVAFASFTDNDLQISIRWATSSLEAMKIELRQRGWEEIPEDYTDEAIKEWAFESDCLIAAELIP